MATGKRVRSSKLPPPPPRPRTTGGRTPGKRQQPRRGSTRRMLQLLVSAAVLVVVAALFVGGVMWFRHVRGSSSSSTIANVGQTLYDEGLALIKTHASDEYTQKLLSDYTASGDDLTALLASLDASAQEIQSLTPENATEEETLYVNALSKIEKDIANCLTSDALADKLAALFGSTDTLHFFDAAAPLVAFDSVDMTSAYFASRYDKGTPDYINCPMDKEQYLAFWQALTAAEEAEVHGFEDKNVFEGCMPVEVMARRGVDTLRYGPMKPVGLRNPATGHEPYAVVQLRQDNAAKSVYNLVGFQTHLKFGEQKRVFSMIPGLENAEFVRYGVMHQNTFLQSPKLLDKYYADRRNPLVAFAGQMTGVEGYVESTASGYLAAVAMAAKVQGREVPDFPKETAIGALGQYVSDESIENFQPMNINFSIIAPLEKRIRKKAEKNLAIAARSLDVIDRLVAKGI